MSDKLPPKILVIEPDEQINAGICNTIERYWFDVNRAYTASSALRSVSIDPPNVVIISSRLTDSSAIEMSASIRKIKGLENLPLVFLIEELEPLENYHNIKGIESVGIKRPFSPSDLMTTIRGMLRRSNPQFQDKLIRYADISMDLSIFKAFKGKKQLHMGPTEFKILQLFITRPTSIFSRRQIIDYVWGVDKDISHRTIDVHINRIRRLTNDKNDPNQIIKTIRSSGYCL